MLALSYSLAFLVVCFFVLWMIEKTEKQNLKAQAVLNLESVLTASTELKRQKHRADYFERNARQMAEIIAKNEFLPSNED